MKAFVCLAALFVLTATSAAAGMLDPKTIVVSGYADMLVKPDHATVNIGVDTSDKLTTKALAANTVLMNRVIEALKAIGVAEKHMQTSNFSIMAQHPQAKDGYSFDMTVTLGYAVSNTLTISVDDVSKVGAIIDTAVKAGANTSNSVTFDAKDSKAYDDKVLTEAVQNARHNAEVMAAAEGAKVGKMISMTSAPSALDIGGFPNANYAPVLARIASPFVMPGEVPIAARVTVVYAVE